MANQLLQAESLSNILRERIQELRTQPACGTSMLADLAAAHELEQILIAVQAGEFDEKTDV